MTTSMSSRSSWIDSVLYKACKDGARYLALVLKTEPGKEPKALLYGGPEKPIPSWIPGLVAAGTPKSEDEDKGEGEGQGVRVRVRHSSGRAYHRLIKDQYPCQVVEGEDRVRELKEMMK